MKFSNLCKTFLLAVLGGVCISIGGAAFLAVDNKIAGAVLFTCGLFTICTFGFNLFTGKVCYLFANKPAYLGTVALIWLGNLAGCFLTGVLLRTTRLISLAEKAQALCQVKLGDSLWSVFVLGIFCNVLIYIAVDGYKNNPHELGKYLSLLFGVTVFILCGFEHCVANMFYFSMAGSWGAQAAVFLLVNTLGNAVGGVLLPLARKACAAK